MRLAAIACANGLGHFVRLTRVLDRLCEILACDIELVCSAWQVERCREMPHLARLLRRRVRLIHGVVEHGVGWSWTARAFEDGRLLGWEDRAATCGALLEADFVLSDNLVGVLSVRPDAVLMGSFLWSDVLGRAHPADREVARFVLHERELLARRAERAPMLCVADLVMPAVRQLTRTVELPWFCERSRVGGGGRTAPLAPRTAPARVAVLGGASRADDALLAALATSLARRAGLEVLVASALAKETRLPVFEPADGYDGLAAAVCRPGVGTLTDCVDAGVPGIMAYTDGNAEMEHNARRAAELGIGWNAGPDLDDVEERVLDAVAEPERFAAAFAALRRDGIERAARWLAAHFLAETRSVTSAAERAGGDLSALRALASDAV